MPRSKPFPVLPLVFLGLATVLMLGGGAWLHLTQNAALRRQAEDNLEAVAQMKVEQLSSWLTERLGDASILMGSSFLIDGVTQWLDTPTDATAEAILGRLRAMCRHYAYDNILLLDAEGRVRLAIDGRADAPLHAMAMEALAEALRTRRPVVIDLHAEGDNGVPHLGVAAPLFAGGEGKGEPVGAFILQTDASRFLFPLIQGWPARSQSAETLLVRRAGDHVLFLNELRHRGNTALNLRIPLDRMQVPAVRAAHGSEGVVYGEDYRGVDVVSVLKPVPHTPWFMIAKMDAAEVYADWHARSALTLVLVVVALALVAAVAGVVWERHRKEQFRALLRVQDALQASEERHRTTLLGIGDAVIATDAAGRVTLMNPVAEQLTGWRQADVGGRAVEQVFRIINEETRATVESPVQRVLREGAVVGLANHTLLVDKAGGERPIADSGAPVRDAAGRITGVILVFRDQTAERAALRALRDSEWRFRTLANSGQALIWTSGIDKKCDWFNQPWLTFTGHTLEHEQGDGWIAGVHPDDLARCVDTYSAAFDRREPFSMVYRLRRHDGRYRWIVDEGMPRFDDNGVFIGYIGHCLDITASKEAEMRIAHLNRILCAIRHVNQLIVRERDPGRLIREGCRLLVEDRDVGGVMIVLTDAADRPVMHAACGLDSRILAPLAAMLERGELPPCCQAARANGGMMRIPTPNAVCGECPLPVPTCMPSDALCLRLMHEGRAYGYLTVTASEENAVDESEHELLVEMAGDIAFALAAVHDRDAAVRSDAARQDLEAQLRQAQKMEAIGRLAGGVAHDFNNMLQAILGNAELALDEVDAGSTLGESIREIQSAAQRSAELTQRLLAFARKQTVQPRELDLNDTVTGMLKMLGRLVGEDVRLAWKPGAKLGNVFIDPSQVDQVLANLAVNARDAISGGGEISIMTANARIDQAFCMLHRDATPGEYVLLSVSDNGCGMSEDTLGHLFEPFFTTKEPGQGTGLGLATVYGIVRQNNGFVAVTSHPGEGSTFTVYLPRHTGGAPAENEPETTAPPARGSETVLLVEDDRTVLRLTRRLLEEMGYTVLPAESAKAALKLVDAFPGDIDLLMTDVVMPGLSGRDLRVRLRERMPNLKCLFMSGYTANIIAHDGVLEDGVDFIAKPFAKHTLATRLRAVLDA